VRREVFKQVDMTIRILPSHGTKDNIARQFGTADDMRRS
jgi:hypothetical protein